MKKLTPRLLATSALTLLALGWMLTSTRSVAAQQGPPAVSVNVVSPVPLPVTGLVKDIGRGTPFTTTSPKTSGPGEPPEVEFTTQVNPGHLLVIEHVSVKLSACAASTMSIEDFELRAGAKGAFLAPVRVLSTFANALIANEELKFVVASGETITVEAEQLSFSSSCGPLSMVATISGVVIPQ